MEILIAVMIFILVSGILFWYANRIEAANIETVRVTLYSRKVTSPLRILHLSDFHLFKGISKSRFAKMKEAIRFEIARQTPDYIFLTGDFVDNNSGIALLPEVLELLSAKSGIYAVLGNHDYFEYGFLHIFALSHVSMGRRLIDIDRLKAAFARFHIPVLIDETVMPQGGALSLLGIDTLTFKRGLVDQVAIPDGANFKMALSHYPDVVHNLMGKVDVLFSGHTHGGQITFFGKPIVSKSHIHKSNIRGVSVYTLDNEETVLIISKGMGVSRYFPIRFFAKPDIVVLDIQAPKE